MSSSISSLIDDKAIFNLPDILLVSLLCYLFAVLHSHPGLTGDSLATGHTLRHGPRIGNTDARKVALLPTPEECVTQLCSVRVQRSVDGFTAVHLVQPRTRRLPSFQDGG